MTGPKEVNNKSAEFAGFQVGICFGHRGCANRAVCDTGLAEDMQVRLRSRNFKSFLEKIVPGDLKRHHEFRLSISDCPNACSCPQIVDVGLIGACRPVVTEEACSRCGACVATCREGAIRLSGGAPQVDAARCVDCGKCVEVCPTGTLQAGTRGYRILVGGKLGRHPRLATELPGIYKREEVTGILDHWLDYYITHCREGERLGEILAREDETFLKG